MKSFEHSLQKLNKFTSDDLDNRNNFNLQTCFGKTINVQGDQAEIPYLKRSSQPLSYDQAIMDSLALLLSDSQISNVPILNSIMKSGEIYIKAILTKSLVQSETFGFFEHIKVLRHSFELPRNQIRYPNFNSLVSMAEIIYQVGLELKSLRKLHDQIYIGMAVDPFSLYKTINELESLFTKNKFTKELSYTIYSQELTLIYCQVLSVHIFEYTEIAKFLDGVIEGKLKEFDQSFIEISFDLRSFILKNDTSKYRRNLNLYFSSTKLFGIKLEDTVPLRQILDLPVFTDIKNSIVFDEFKKHATFLSNQEFSLAPATFNDNIDNFVNFKTKVLENFTSFYNVNFELYKILKSTDIQTNSFDYTSCLKLFNFLVGYGHLSHYFGFSRILSQKGQSSILSDFPTIISRVLGILTEKARVLSLVSKEDNLDINVTNVYFLESLFRLFTFCSTSQEITSSSFASIKDQLRQMISLISNNIDIEAFSWIFIRLILFIPNSQCLLEIFCLLLKGQFAKGNLDLCEILFKRLRHSDNAETLSFSYEHIARNSATYLQSMQDKSIWDLFIEILPSLEIRELHYFTDIVEVILDFNQMSHLRIVYDSFIGQLTSILAQLEISNTESSDSSLRISSLRNLFKMLESLKNCIKFANFKSYGLSKKVTEMFIKIHQWIQQNTATDELLSVLLANIKLVNLDILLILSSTSVGLRAYMDQSQELKAILEDMPIESHIKRIFELIELEDFALDLNEASEIELETKLRMLEIFGGFLTNNMSKNLLLQLIDGKGSIFNFIKLFTADNSAAVKNLYKNTGKMKLLFRYLFEFINALIQFFKIHSSAEAKCLLSVLGLSIAIDEKDKEGDNDHEVHYARIKAVFKELTSFTSTVLKTPDLISYTQRLFIQQGLKTMKSEVSKKKKKFKGLEKKVKFEFKDIMPDELEHRISLANSYVRSFEFRKVQLAKLIEKFDLPLICGFVTTIGNNKMIGKSFKLGSELPKATHLLPVVSTLMVKMHMKHKSSSLEAIKLKIKNLYPIFKDLVSSNANQVSSISAKKIGSTIIYKPEPQFQQHTRVPHPSAQNPNASYLVFNAKKPKEEISQHINAPRKLYRTQAPHAHPSSQFPSDVMNQIRQQNPKIGHGDHSHTNLPSGAVHKMIKTATGGPTKSSPTNFNVFDKGDINNPMSKLISSLPFKQNLIPYPGHNPQHPMGYPDSNLNNPQGNIYQDKSQYPQRQYDDGRPSFSGSDLKRNLGDGGQDQKNLLNKANPALLNTLSGQIPMMGMNRMPMYSTPYNMPMHPMMNQIPQDQNVEDIALGKRPVMNYPTMTVLPHNQMMGMNMPPMQPGQPFMTPQQIQMMNQMFMLQNQQMMSINKPFNPNQGQTREQNPEANLSSYDQNQGNKPMMQMPMPNPQLLAQLAGMPPGMMYPPGMGGMPQHFNPMMQMPMPIPMPSIHQNIPSDFTADKNQPAKAQKEIFDTQGQTQKNPNYPSQQLPISPNAQFNVQNLQPMNPQFQKYPGYSNIQTNFESPYSPHTQNIPLLTPPQMYPRSPHHGTHPSPHSNHVGRTTEDSYEFSDNQFSDEESEKQKEGRDRRPKVQYEKERNDQNTDTKPKEESSKAELETKSFLQQLAKTPGARFLTKQP